MGIVSSEPQCRQFNTPDILWQLGLYRMRQTGMYHAKQNPCKHNSGPASWYCLPPTRLILGSDV